MSQTQNLKMKHNLIIFLLNHFLSKKNRSIQETHEPDLTGVSTWRVKDFLSMLSFSRKPCGPAQMRLCKTPASIRDVCSPPSTPEADRGTQVGKSYLNHKITDLTTWQKLIFEIFLRQKCGSIISKYCEN